jgi:3-phenylpropionate/cinnamic acid dioxygenase small subunit
VLSQQELADHVEIGQIIQRYGRALDEKQFDQLDTVFAPDAQMHYVMPDGSTNDAPLEQWKKIFPAFMQPFYWTSHMFSQPVIELAGNSAEARCRLIAVHVQETKTGERNLWTVYGNYRDRMARTPDGWRIVARHFQGVHTEGQMLPAGEVVSFPTLPFEA